jgi:hypothetical protein
MEPAPVILSDHARRRLRQRFPGVDEDDLLVEFEAAAGHHPTNEETRAIKDRCRPADESKGILRVSPSGIVFVVAEGSIVVTLFPMPIVKGRPHDSLVRRNKRRNAGRSGRVRRSREKHRWLRDDE